jgi:hypothetical protein
LHKNTFMLRFEDLSPAEKRVVIAQDVIKQIRLKNITPVRGLTLAYIEGKTVVGRVP